MYRKYYWVTDKDGVVVSIGGQRSCRNYYRNKGGTRTGHRLFYVLRPQDRPAMGARTKEENAA